MQNTSISRIALCFTLAAFLIAAVSSLALGSETAEVTVRESGDNYFVLDFTAPSPTFGWREHNGSMFDTVKVAGCESIAEPGKPDVPFVGFLLAIPGKCRPYARCESIQDESYFDLRIAPCLQPVEVDAGHTTVIEPRFVLDERQYATDSYYPDSPVKAEFFGVFRGQPLIRVMVFPVRFNPVSGDLRVLRRATIKVFFDLAPGRSDGRLAGVLCSETGPSQRMVNAVKSCVANPQDVRPLLVQGEPAPGLTATKLSGASDRYKIAVSEDGIYRLTGADLAGAGIDLSAIDVSHLSLKNLGQEVPIMLEDGGDGSFDDADYILFWGEAPDSEFTNDNIYWLSFDDSGAYRMQESDAHPTGTAQVATSFVETLHIEQDNVYWQNIPNGEGEDHYFYSKVTAPDTEVFPLDLYNLSPQPFDATFVAEFRGRTDVDEVDPDHHTQIILNDQVIDDRTWNGQIKFVQSVTGPQSMLAAGRNELKINYPGDLTLLDQVYLNYVQVTYLATFVATEGVLTFSPQETGRTEFRIGGFPSDDILVFDVTNPLAVRYLGNTSVEADGDGYLVSFEDDSSPNKRYLVLDNSVVKTGLSLTLDVPSSLRSPDNRADYIIISHADLIEAAQGIAQHHAAKGEAVLVADVEDIYDEFNFGVKSPDAIRDFLKYAYENFSPPPPTDVLLVGDANMDYKNRIGHEVDFVPTHVHNDPDPNRIGETPGDNWFVCVDGSDILPDMNIGRICARRASDVDDALAKIEAYDNGQASGDWLHRVLFVADNEGVSVSLNQMLSTGFLPEDYSATQINYNDYGSSESANQEIMSSINEGCLLLNYTGHGNVNRWAKGMFDSGDVGQLENGDKMPFVIMLTCLNGFFPMWDSTACLGDVFARVAGKGAIASWAPTSVDTASNHQILARTFFEAVFYDFNCYLGAATTVAKVRGYAQAGYISYFDEIVKTFTLFGDPGLALAVPTAPSSPRLIVWTDRDTYYAGQTVNVDVMLENTGGESMQVDAYLALYFNGALLYYPSFGLDPSPIRVDLPPFLKLRLRATSLMVPSPAPAGNYTFFAALTEPGDMSNFIGGISQAQFEVR